MNNFFDFALNPYANVIKKHLYGILKEKYPADDEIIDRLSKSLVTQKDVADFAELISALYTAGFMEAVEQNRSLFEKLGHKVQVSFPEVQKPAKKIFPDQEKSG